MGNIAKMTYLAGQIDWLTGGVLARQHRAVAVSLDMNSALFDPTPSFAKGNGENLSSAQLYDMIEIWTCLGVLMQGFRDKISEARAAGIFDNLPEIVMPHEDYKSIILEEWTYYILTLGPFVCLYLLSVSPAGPTSETFQFAKEAGWTTWELPAFGTSRRLFLQNAVSRVYERKLAAEHGQSHVSRSSTKGHENKSMSESRKRQKALAQELRRKKGYRQ